jgi:uncharacterized protein DUF1778
MPTILTRTADADARIKLPKKFANAKVVVQIQPAKTSAPRTRKGSKRRFVEESITRLSDADRDRFLQLLESPPKPNAALKKAMATYRASHG